MTLDGTNKTVFTYGIPIAGVVVKSEIPAAEPADIVVIRNVNGTYYIGIVEILNYAEISPFRTCVVFYYN
jgi:hypothetical protein